MSVGNEPILENEYWSVTLEPNQAYLGQCFINLKQHKSDLSELIEAEWLAFADVVKKLEAAIRSAFGPDLFNWTCLMNNAYRSASAKPHVHWSAVPRYRHPVTFYGAEFTDPQFGYHYDIQHKLEVSGEVMAAIADEIGKHV